MLERVREHRPAAEHFSGANQEVVDDRRHGNHHERAQLKRTSPRTDIRTFPHDQRRDNGDQNI